MNLLNIIPGEYKRVGGKNGGEYAGGCPWCGDGGKGRSSDRFHIWPEQGSNGTYWCRMCGRGGDAIKYLIDHDGMNFKAALDHLGLHPDILGPKTDKVPAGWQPSAAVQPADIWADHAKKFALWCHARLLERPIDLAWLAERGIQVDMVKKYRLGWNPAHAWRERPAWGVAPERKPDGKMKKLWLPRGLVIPLFSDFSEGATVLRLRVRQPDQSPRYLVIPGSCREPLCSGAAEAMVIVESELDAIVLDGLAGDLVGVVAMGNDTAKPTAALLPALGDALTILVAMDSDPPKYNKETGNMDMPGAKASRWWLSQFDQAVRVPVIGGKDPGEAYAAGVDLRAWVMAALPAYFHVKADLAAERLARRTRCKQPPCPQAVETAPEAGQDNQAKKENVTVSENVTREAETPQDTAAKVHTITLKNGRSFMVTADRDEWQRLTDAGELVFSEHELKRLQDACSTMGPDERLAAAMLVLDMKEVFTPAWIRRGEAVALPKGEKI